MSIPAFVRWLDLWHGPGICPLNHCPGCAMYSIFELLYPNDPNARELTHSEQWMIIKDVENLLSDADGYFQKLGIPIAESMNSWNRIWLDDGTLKPGTKKGTNARAFSVFLCEAFIKRGTLSSRRQAASIFGLHVDKRFNCPANPTHVFHTRDAEKWINLKLKFLWSEQDSWSQIGGDPRHSKIALALERHLNYPRKAKCKTCGAKAPIFYRISDRGTPEVVTLELDFWDTDSWYKDGKIIGRKKTSLIDDVEFSDCLDLTRYLNPERQANGEKAMYRLSAMILHGMGVMYNGDSWGHVVTVVRGANETWALANDDLVMRDAKRNRLVTILQRIELDHYVPFLLVYVKAAGDTTQNPDENKPVSDSDWVFVNAVGDTSVAPPAAKEATDETVGAKFKEWEVEYESSDDEKESPERVNTEGRAPGTPVAKTTLAVTPNSRKKRDRERKKKREEELKKAFSGSKRK